eukprot:TRINITY_DN12856_c0_g1_i1.p1 TRINITY_DN12856_c0_g1~~TRINITY_DN12856_c0_g1_i1.p1  ORF type:complete len:814 (-),score=115.13 TRINITY_DN12856_c0_g1_i1:23-2464(-)
MKDASEDPELRYISSSRAASHDSSKDDDDDDDLPDRNAFDDLAKSVHGNDNDWDEDFDRKWKGSYLLVDIPFVLTIAEKDTIGQYLCGPNFMRWLRKYYYRHLARFFTAIYLISHVWGIHSIGYGVSRQVETVIQSLLCITLGHQLCILLLMNYSILIELLCHFEVYYIFVSMGVEVIAVCMMSDDLVVLPYLSLVSMLSIFTGTFMDALPRSKTGFHRVVDKVACEKHVPSNSFHQIPMLFSFDHPYTITQIVLASQTILIHIYRGLSCMCQEGMIRNAFVKIRNYQFLYGLDKAFGFVYTVLSNVYLTYLVWSNPNNKLHTEIQVSILGFDWDIREVFMIAAFNVSVFSFRRVQISFFSPLQVVGIVRKYYRLPIVGSWRNYMTQTHTQKTSRVKPDESNFTKSDLPINLSFENGSEGLVEYLGDYQRYINNLSKQNFAVDANPPDDAPEQMQANRDRSVICTMPFPGRVVNARSNYANHLFGEIVGDKIFRFVSRIRRFLFSMWVAGSVMFIVDFIVQDNIYLHIASNGACFWGLLLQIHYFLILNRDMVHYALKKFEIIFLMVNSAVFLFLITFFLHQTPSAVSIGVLMVWFTIVNGIFADAGIISFRTFSRNIGRYKEIDSKNARKFALPRIETMAWMVGNYFSFKLFHSKSKSGMSGDVNIGQQPGASSDSQETLSFQQKIDCGIMASRKRGSLPSGWYLRHLTHFWEFVSMLLGVCYMISFYIVAEYIASTNASIQKELDESLIRPLFLVKTTLTNIIIFFVRYRVESFMNPCRTAAIVSPTYHLFDVKSTLRTLTGQEPGILESS